MTKAKTNVKIDGQSYDQMIKVYGRFRDNMSHLPTLKQWKYSRECTNTVYWTTPFDKGFIRISATRFDNEQYSITVGYSDHKNYIANTVFIASFPVSKEGFQAFEFSLSSWLLVNSTVADFRLESTMKSKQSKLKRCPVIQAVNKMGNDFSCKFECGR